MALFNHCLNHMLIYSKIDFISILEFRLKFYKQHKQSINKKLKSFVYDENFGAFLKLLMTFYVVFFLLLDAVVKASD